MHAALIYENSPSSSKLSTAAAAKAGVQCIVLFFLDALESPQLGALKAFGNATVLVEKFIERPRHVEVQAFADTTGNMVTHWEGRKVFMRSQAAQEVGPQKSAMARPASVRALPCARYRT